MSRARPGASIARPRRAPSFAALRLALTCRVRSRSHAARGSFDPLGFKSKFGGNTAEGYKTLQLKEIKNGRLAMMAVAGMFTQQLLTGKGPLEQLF